MPPPARLVALLSLSLQGGCAAAPAAPTRASQAAAPPAPPACALPPPGSTSPWPAAGLAARSGPPAEEMVANARWHRAAGDRAAAMAWLEKAAATAPDHPEVCYELADLLLADEADLDRAAAMLLAIPAGHPRRDGALGRVAELRGDLETAQAAYARQLSLAEDPELRLRRAAALERLGRDAEAVAELERLRDADPRRPAPRVRLAEKYEALGRLAEAETELRALAEASAGRPEGWRRLAAFLGRHGQDEQASAAEARARLVEAPPPRRELRPLLPTGR